MDNNQFQFLYDNILLYQFNSDWVVLAIAIIIWIICMIWLYYVILFGSLKSIEITADKLLAKKKKTLTELILMKDIQTDLEKEIEEAILKAAFRP